MMWTMLLLVSSVFCARAAGVPLPVPASDNKVYTWSIDDKLITDVANDGSGQIVSNAQSSGDGSAYANLIDEDINTLFHSVWTTDYAKDEAPKNGTGYHNLQVRLNEAVDVFFFRYIGRNNETYHDNPTAITIYATNDETLAASASYADSPNDKWDLVTTLKDGFPTNSAGLYTSPAIVLSQPYKYFRFVVTETNTLNKVSWRQFTFPELTGVTFNLSEFQMYQGYEVTDPYDLLQVLYNEIIDAGVSVSAGTDPGYYPEELANSFQRNLVKAEEALSSSQGDLQGILDALKADWEKVQTSMIGITSGYYNFISAYGNFENNQNVRMSLQAVTNGGLRWKAYSEEDAYSLFKVVDLGNGTYTVQNVATEEYLSTTPGTATVQTTAQESTPQVFTSVGLQQFLISNTENPLGYTADNVGDGKNQTGNIVTWTGGVNSTSSWYLHQVTDEDLIQRVIAGAAAQVATDLLEQALETAKQVRKKANDYVPLLTSASQITGNSIDLGSGGNYGALLDNNINTIVHTMWNESFRQPQIEGTGWHNLQVTLPQAIEKMKFSYIGRNVTNGWTDSPNHITIYATNDEQLAQSTAAADSLLWTQIIDLTKANTDFPGNMAAAPFESDVYDLHGAYKYIRFVVKNTSCMDGGNRAGAFASPNVTGVTFNLSEFQVYDGTPASSSEYYTVEGMKGACDELDRLMAEAAEKVANKTAKLSDVTAIENACKAIENLYVDRGPIRQEMANLLKSANELYDNVVAYKVITNVSNNEAGQVKVNSSMGYNLINLINGDSEDAEAIYHSVWDNIMKRDDVTPEEYKEFNENKGGVGYGYHNIQIRFNQPESKFYFKFTGRNSVNWSDTPNYIKILATNDDELGASADNADEASWDEIVVMANRSYYKSMYDQELPANVVDAKFPDRGSALAHYTSPVIDMKQKYKYVRFVVLGTNNADLYGADRGINRNFNSPDVTGISWNTTEFQLYGVGDVAQINSVAGMREVAEKLKAILDVDNALPETFYDQKKLNELKAAYEAVEALYIDRSSLATKMDQLIRDSRKLYSRVAGNPLVMSSEQLSTNSADPSQGGPLSNLIDDDLGTVFHSIWLNTNEDGTNFGMKSANITENEWTELMSADAKFSFSGIGYHNLQVAFDHPVSQFFYDYTGRNNATWSDSPTMVEIYATNDDQLGASTNNADQDAWDEIATLEEGAKANSALAYFRSSVIDMKQAYKYVRLVIKRTTNSSRPEKEADNINRLFRSPDVTGITWNASEFQLYESGDVAQINYIDGMKEVAQKLLEVVAAKEVIKSDMLLPMDYVELQAAYQAVKDLYADAPALLAKLAEVNAELAIAEISTDKVGYAPSQDVIDALQSTHDAVKGSMTNTMKKEEIDGAIDKLATSLETYYGSLNKVQPNTWYYILNSGSVAYCNEGAISMTDANEGGIIRWGGAVTNDEYLGKAASMWRFVPIEGQENAYAIQNYLTTHYIGAYRGNGNENYPMVSNTPQPYQVKYATKGQMQIISLDSTNVDAVPLHAQEADCKLVSWPGSVNSASVWTFEAVEGDDAFFTVEPNSIQILTLPFDMLQDGVTISDLNMGVATYKLKNLTVEENGSTKVELTLQNTFAAGEPFVMVYGDYEAYEAGQPVEPIIFLRSDEITGQPAQTVNGLVGTFESLPLNKRRMGYITSDGLHLTSSTTVINAMSGYINPTLVTPQDGETDLILTVNGKIDGVAPIAAAKADAPVNVYGIDGKLIKRNVKADEATRQLKRGIYIIGKKKVAVK